jgi:hypothetical protein
VVVYDDTKFKNFLGGILMAMQGRVRADNRDPVYSIEQVDQLILTPEARSTVIIKKKPKYEKVPIYAKDESGQKIALLDEDGHPIVDSDGAQRYMIKDYDYVQRGWISAMEVVPASELFTIDLATSNISGDAVRLITFLMWNYDHILSLHEATDDDYSVLLHKIRNDIVSVVSAAKSYNGGTVASVKTYRTINDNKQWQYLDGMDNGQKSNPLSTLFGGFGKPKENQQDQEKGKYTAFQQS